MEDKSRRLAYMVIIFIVLPFLIMTIFAIGVLIPMNMSDDWGKLDGIAREEDKPFILGNTWTGIDMLSSSKPGGFYAKNRIAKVEYTPTGRCIARDDVRSYTITTKLVGLFGMTIDQTIHRPPVQCVDLRYKYSH